MKILVTGVSGTGKSSLARFLSKRGVTTIDLDDDLCHWRNRKTGETTGWEPGRSDAWYAEHGWLCELPDLKAFLDSNEDVVAVGLSSNQEEYLPWFDKVVLLYSKPETVVKRLMTRIDNDYGKHPNEQQRLLNWQPEFDRQMREKGAIAIDADQPIAEVAEQVLELMRS